MVSVCLSFVYNSRGVLSRLLPHYHFLNSNFSPKFDETNIKIFPFRSLTFRPVGSTFRRGFLLVAYITTIALKCTVIELRVWDRQTDGRTDGQTNRETDRPQNRLVALMPPYRSAGHNNPCLEDTVSRLDEVSPAGG